MYDLGIYIDENDLATHGKRFSETGKFAVLAALRKYIDSESRLSEKTVGSSLEQATTKAWQPFWANFVAAISRKDFKSGGQWRFTGPTLD